MEEKYTENPTLRNGEIYSWRYRQGICSKYSDPYWCKSQIAVCKDGKLFDTYWLGGFECTRGDSVLNLDQIEVRLIANLAYLEKIPDNQYRYYAEADRYCFNHPNRPRNHSFVVKGAQRSRRAMREYAQEKYDEAQSKVESAKYDLEIAKKMLALVADGKLDEVYL